MSYLKVLITISLAVTGMISQSVGDTLSVDQSEETENFSETATMDQSPEVQEVPGELSSDQPAESVNNLDKKKYSGLINIAVLNLKNAEGISEGDAGLITDRLNVELFKTNKVNLLEREQINDILSEQGFQGSGACTDEECLVEMGQILGVQEIIAGSIGELGKLFILNLRSIDVATGKILKVVSQDIPGRLEDVIYYLPNIARKLVGLEPVAMKESPPVKKTAKKSTKKMVPQIKPSKNSGMVVVKTIPAGAVVYLNDKKYGVTPFVDNTILPGKYILKIKLPRYETYSEIFSLPAGYTHKVSRNLFYKYSVITIKTEPKAAKVKIDEKNVGLTPYYSDSLIPGEHVLNLSMEGYKSINEKFNAIKNVRDTIFYTLYTLASLDSARSFEKEMRRGGRNARRIIFGVLAAGAWGAGIYFNTEVDKNLSKEEKLLEKYNETPTSGNPITESEFDIRYEKYKDAVDKTEENMMLRNILYGVGGLFTFCFAISIPF